MPKHSNPLITAKSRQQSVRPPSNNCKAQRTFNRMGCMGMNPGPPAVQCYSRADKAYDDCKKKTIKNM